MGLGRFFRRAAWDRERAREMDAHIAMMADDLRAEGVPEAEALQRARARFGNAALAREEIYEMNSLPVIETILRDGRYALRLLRRSPGFALTAILTLAVAIGANAAVFSLVDAILLRPLPYPQPGQLANVEYRQVSPRGTFEGTSVDGAMWEAIREYVKSADVAVYSDWRGGVNLALPGQALNVDQQRVSAGFFRVLGVTPLYGREFTGEEDRAGGPNAVILSHGLWRRAFGADPSVVGTTALVRGDAHQIVGVMPETLRASAPTDLWTPVRASRTGEGGGTNFAVMVRVPAGTAWQAVDAELNTAFLSLGYELREGVSVNYGLLPLQQNLTSASRDALLSMWAAVGLVLLIACVNLAGLLLARARTRAREIATRMALGSGRRAVVRQLLVESVTLALIGAILGVLLGHLMLNGLQALAADQYAMWEGVALDWRAVAVTGGLSMLAAVIFGVIPAVHASRVDVQAGLRDGGVRGASAGSGGWTRRALVVAEVALGLVLLVGAGLLTRTFVTLKSLEPGFDLTNVVTGSASLQDTRYQTREQIAQLFERSLERIKATPGVESAAVSLGLPYERILNLGFSPLDGAAAAETDRNFITNVTYVTPDYFRTLRMPLRAGREVNDGDRDGAQPVVVVNEAFQRLYYASDGALGRTLAIAGMERQVVGIVGDVQYRQPGWGTGGPIRTTPIVYLPVQQTPARTLNLVHTWFSPTWIARTSGPIAGVEQALRAAVADVDPLLPLASVRSMAEVRARATASQRFMMVLAGLLAGASMLLAAIGIHGMIASSITERTREIGIRMALGSTAAQAMRTVTLPGIGLTIIGLVLGAAIARASTSYIASLLWGVEPDDPLTYAVVAALLLLVAVVASVIPALRILRLDPAQTLRA
ncbi:MAG TPA: ABC transporter permease [Vicinamibacterales bacterium]|nr:ABC transporter permease [Vicinamibacterales bacterium]